MSSLYSAILTVGVWEMASHPKLHRSAWGIKIMSLTSQSVLHQAFLFHLRRTLAVWTQLSQLWQTAVGSTVLFMWIWWVTASRPSTVQDVALKCPMVCSISKELRPFRYSPNLWQRPQPWAARKLYHGNKPFGPSPEWVCWGSHGRRTTASRVISVGQLTMRS